MSKVFRRITADTFLYSIMPQLPKLMNFFLLPLTSPYLSTLDFAVFGTVMAFVLGFDILKSLGLDIILMNSFFKTPGLYKEVWRKVEAIISIWSFLLTIVIGLVVYLILPNELSISDRWLIIISISLPSMMFSGLSKISILFYQFNQRPAPIVIRSFIVGLLAVVLNYYFIAILKIGFKGWFYSGVITGILLPLTYLYAIWVKEKLTPIYRFKGQEVNEMLKISLPLLPHHYANYFLNYSDRILLSIFHTPTPQIGIYNLGYSVSGNFRLFSNSIDKVIGPMFHKNLIASGDVRIIKKIVFALATLYIMIGFLGGLWMKEFFFFFIRNEELSSAYTVAIVVLFSFATRPLYNG
ncbi:MAG TPA: oligosaccharide flippase family protein, partial [Cyclobacteriaceae bacterium]|nr:oligosaccharide flippase family protein [Cyclobacteriaceae bacterium]